MRKYSLQNSSASWYVMQFFRSRILREWIILIIWFSFFLIHYLRIQNAYIHEHQYMQLSISCLDVNLISMNIVT